MILSLVVAHGKNLEIGKDNKLLWHCKEDLQHFKQLTLNHTIIMGRKTFESIGRPLPQRRNIILSRTTIPGVECFSTLESALQEVKNEAEVFVIGGGAIYAQALPLAHKLYVTKMDWQGPADTYFPDYRNDPYWKKVQDRPLVGPHHLEIWERQIASQA